MGSNNLFARAASIDPIAQALDLPGAHKYAQSQAQDVQTNAGPYAGQTPTLGAALAGYVPGDTAHGATAGWTPNQNTGGPGFMGSLQRGANFFGNQAPAYGPGGLAAPSTSTGNNFVQNSQTANPNPAMANGGINPYVTAARGAAQQNPQYGTN